MADPSQLPPPESAVFQQFTGLKNTVTAERLGPGDLERGTNIDLDDAQQIRRRRGYTLVSSGNFHSLFEATDATYVVKNGSLGIIYPDYTFETLLPNAGADPIAYVEVGDVVYFSSATVSGKIGADKNIYSWGAEVSPGTWLSPVVNPTSTLGQVNGKLLGAPPMATALALWHGRIYLANDKTLWATELYLYNYVDKTKNFLQFEAPITVLGAVTDGIYVGTENAVYFLSGELRMMQRVPILSVGALRGSMVNVPAELVHPEDQPTGSRNAVVFMTEAGLCAGFDGGVCYNLTQTTYLFPKAQSVAAMFRQQDGINQYVGVADSGGTPSSNARIGDFVDAEIRRFQGA